MRNLELHCERFRERCFNADFSVLSAITSAEEVLQPAEKHLFDLARGLLADPEVLVLHDMLNVMPLPLAENALEVLLLWQSLGGLKGLVLAFEGRFMAVQGYPDWITAGGLKRSLLLSESSIVCVGLRMTSCIGDWLVINPGGALELETGWEMDDAPRNLSLARQAGAENGLFGVHGEVLTSKGLLPRCMRHVIQARPDKMRVIANGNHVSKCGSGFTWRLLGHAGREMGENATRIAIRACRFIPKARQRRGVALSWPLGINVDF